MQRALLTMFSRRYLNTYNRHTHASFKFCCKKSRKSRWYLGRHSLPRIVRLPVNLTSDEGLDALALIQAFQRLFGTIRLIGWIVNKLK